jgi:hypothetical protein
MFVKNQETDSHFIVETILLFQFHENQATKPYMFVINQETDSHIIVETI